MGVLRGKVDGKVTDHKVNYTTKERPATHPFNIMDGCLTSKGTCMESLKNIKTDYEVALELL